MSLLKISNDHIQLHAVLSHDPQTSFRQGLFLYVFRPFNELVLSKAKKVENLGSTSFSSFDLTADAYSRDIKAAAPANHVFDDESELCARIEQLLSKQLHGEKGDLLTNGYANLFYLPNCVVCISWDKDDHGWYLMAYASSATPGPHPGSTSVTGAAGCRVFCRN